MKRLGGTVAALPTPFGPQGIDRAALAGLAHDLVAGGVAGLAVATVAGEGPTLEPDEVALAIRIVARVSAGRVPVMAGVTTSATWRAAEACIAAARAGADAALVAVPPYSRPSPAGVVAHFETLVGQSPIPVVAHHAPGRTAIPCGPDLAERLARIPGLAGLVCGIGGLQPMRSCVPIPILAAGDEAWLRASVLTADGLFSDLACLTVGLSADRRMSMSYRPTPSRLAALLRLTGPEPDPALIKAALALLRPGFPAAVRLPLVEAPPEAARILAAVLASPSAAPARQPMPGRPTRQARFSTW